MENATKALLIAAAILIAIIIISFGIFVVNQGQEAVQGADLSEAEAAQFNSKFLTYQGENVSVAQVNALLNTVLAHNLQETENGNKKYINVAAKVTVSNGKPATSGTYYVKSTSVNVENRLTGNDRYTVKCYYTGRLISAIQVTKN